MYVQNVLVFLINARIISIEKMIHSFRGYDATQNDT